MGTNQKREGSLIVRLVIILYGVGIVMIGLHPIRTEHGSFLGFVAKETGSLAYQAASNMPELKERRKEDAEGIRGSLNSAFPFLRVFQYRQSPPPAAVENKPEDHLTEDDKEQLDSLIDTL